MLAWAVHQVFENLDFFRLVERNHQVTEVMMEAFASIEGTSRCTSAWRRRPRRRRPTVIEQVRMIAALGAVTGFDDWAPTLLKEAPAELLEAELVASTRRILDLPPR